MLPSYASGATLVRAGSSIPGGGERSAKETHLAGLALETSSKLRRSCVQLAEPGSSEDCSQQSVRRAPARTVKVLDRAN
jgi:hypothetical protein